MSLNLQKIALEIGLDLVKKIDYLDATHFEKHHTEEMLFRVDNLRPSQQEIQALFESSVKLQNLEKVADICMRELQLKTTHKNYIKRVKARQNQEMDKKNPKRQSKRNGEAADFTEAVFSTAFNLMQYSVQDLALNPECENQIKERLRQSNKASSEQMKLLVGARHRLGLIARCSQAALDILVENYGTPPSRSALKKRRN